MLGALLLAAGVGHLVGRRSGTGIVNVLSEMTWTALLVARLVFVVTWFDLYQGNPWSMLDIRDGGFTAWAGLTAAALLAIWRGWQRAALRKPLLAGVTAGAMGWAVLAAASGAFTGALTPSRPALVLNTLAGEPTDLAKVAAGKPMVLNLWASWCPPCRREMPVLAAAQQREAGISFVFANQGEQAETAQRYLSASGLGLANVLFDVKAELGPTVGSRGLPTTLFYDASGRLVDTHVGELSAASLASKLKRLR
ncbi:MAG: TlpA family protein disulfide reductase [Polaromonas sp.]|nr:TlpA family protein disulfide reductase [Polaromonas sp.]